MSLGQVGSEELLEMAGVQVSASHRLVQLAAACSGWLKLLSLRDDCKCRNSQFRTFFNGKYQLTSEDPKTERY